MLLCTKYSLSLINNAYLRTGVIGCLCLLFYYSVLCQTRKRKLPDPKTYVASSADSRYFAVDYSAKRFYNARQTYLHILKAYHIKSRRYISRIDYEHPTDIEWLRFSPGNNKLYALAGDDILLFDIKRRVLQRKFENAQAIGFTAGDGQALVAQAGKIQAYDMRTNKPTEAYTGLLKGTTVTAIGQDPTQKWIYAQIEAGIVYFWETGQPQRPYQKISAVELKFIPEKGFINAVSYRQRLCFVSQYRLEDLQLVGEFNSDAYLSYATYTFNAGTSLSPDGEWVTLCAKRFEQTIGLGVMEVATGELLYNLDTTWLGDRYYPQPRPYQWINHHELLLQRFGKGAVSLNIETGTRTDLVFRHRFPNYRISPDGKMVASFAKERWKQSAMLAVVPAFESTVRDALIENATFLGFSPDSRYLFIEHPKEKTHAFILLEEVAKGEDPYQYKFATKPYNPADESVIEEDATPPEGYQHFYLKQVKPWPGTEKDTLHWVTKGAQWQGENLAVDFHLLNEAGVHFQQAKEWLDKRLCEITLKDSLGNQIARKADYQWQEMTPTTADSLNLSVVMDHSGSMGEARAMVVQEAVADLVRQKAGADLVSLFKYDHRILMEVAPASDTARLLGRFQQNGLGRLGGATALLDAAHQAVQLQAQDRSERQRAVVIFTDGFENSSVITTQELIEDALQHQVQLYTIGFGAYIEEALLEELAQATGGSYYRIYRTADFLEIFADVYRKMHHYYRLQMPLAATDLQGYSGPVAVELRACQDSLPLLKTTFYTPNHWEKELEKPVKNLSESELEAEGYTNFETDPRAGDIKLLNVNFHFATTRLTSGSLPEVQKAIDYLKKHPGIKAELRGHTDSVGSEAYNQQLSERRAEKIRQMLVAAGVDPARLTAKGLGESMPIASNNTEAGRLKNRRTELVILTEK